jgi:hypothetical protein
MFVYQHREGPMHYKKLIVVFFVAFLASTAFVFADDKGKLIQGAGTSLVTGGTGAPSFVPVKTNFAVCGSKVNLSGVNGNVIMSGWEDDNPDNERRAADKDNTESVSRRSDGGASGSGARTE